MKGLERHNLSLEEKRLALKDLWREKWGKDFLAYMKESEGIGIVLLRSAKLYKDEISRILEIDLDELYIGVKGNREKFKNKIKGVLFPEKESELFKGVSETDILRRLGLTELEIFEVLSKSRKLKKCF